MTKLPSDTFCIIPWIHLNTWPNGKVYQCCITDWTNSIGDLSDSSMAEVWNNEYMKVLRLDLLAGKQGVGCSKCYEQEAHSIISSRNTFNKNFSKHIDAVCGNTQEDGSVEELSLVYWDFRFSNLCNMKCRMCGGHLSSMWNVDEEALYGRASEPDGVVNVDSHSVDDIKQLLADHMDVVEEIYFAGGEPLIMDEHYYILDQLISRGKTDVRLRYNTNMAKLSFKRQQVMELWEHFDHVHVIASIDAVGNRAEYIRKGTVWATVEKNIKTVLSDSSIMMGFSPTINIFNIYHIPELVDYLIGLGVSIHSIHLNNVLTGPEFYHIGILPDDMKEQIRQIYDKHLASFTDDVIKTDLQIKYDSIMSYLNTEFYDVDSLRTQFIQKTALLDGYRSESLVAACPELESFIERYIT